MYVENIMLCNIFSSLLSWPTGRSLPSSVTYNRGVRVRSSRVWTWSREVSSLSRGSVPEAGESGTPRDPLTLTTCLPQTNCWLRAHAFRHPSSYCATFTLRLVPVASHSLRNGRPRHVTESTRMKTRRGAYLSSFSAGCVYTCVRLTR